jgi:hypothetical protein
LCAPVADSVERHREAAIAQVAAGGDFVRDALPVEQSTRDGSARPTALRSTAGALRRILAVALCGLALGTPAAPAEAEFDEQRVMAAFLFNFVKFVSWPEDAFSGPDASIEIAVLGDPSFRDLMAQSVRDKLVGGRPLQVTVVSAPFEAKSAHLLFMPAHQAPRADQVAGLRGTHVLTVADADGFARSGGMVAFVRENNKLRFEINESAAKQAGLSGSSRLLSVAGQVH